LDQAIAELYSSNKKLALRLFKEKIISLEQLEQFLGNDRMPLGQTLLQKKLIFKPELDQALVDQKGSNKKLGEILVEKNIITSEQLKRNLT
jgi:hypothetical protein